MPSLFPRDPAHHYPVAARSEGVYIYDTDGRQYLDGSGGAAVSSVGHHHPKVIEAIRRQVDEMAYAHTAFFTNSPQEELARRLAERFPAEDARVYFVSGGSEANETALKLARQYWVAKGRTDKSIVISRQQSYHGNTLGALALSGNPQRTELFGPMIKQWPKAEPCYAYRHQGKDESDEDYAERAAQSLEDRILEVGADRVAAFFAETVVGATLGCVPPVPGYFRRIREICDRHDVLLVLDEVMCGNGRCGTWFSFEQDGVVPDIVTTAKGIGGGYQPLGAVIASHDIYRAIVDVHSSFSHGFTYIGHATACAAGVAVMQVIDEEDLVERVSSTGALLRERLADAFSDHPNVGDIRGRGLFIGVELVSNRDEKTPFTPELKLPARIRESGMQQGLICYPFGGCADGVNGVHILLAPPYTYEAGHVDELVGKLQQAIDVNLG